jgi:hypothetical protein
VCADGDVLVYREPGERLHNLKSAGYPAARHKVGRKAGDIRATVKDAAFARRQEPADNREQRGLAGAVRPDQGGNTAGFDRK